MTRDTWTTRQGPRASVDARAAESGTSGAREFPTGRDRVGDRLARHLAQVRVERALVPALGAVFVTVVAIVQWRLWRGGLGVPITYSGDASFYHSITKTIADYGWYFTNPRLGAPYSRILYDYPLGFDNLNYLGVRALTWFSDNPFVVNNVFALLTFPVVFAASWFAFRRLRFSPGVACTAAVVYTLAPYHFFRADVHLPLAAYYAVPLGCLLLYELIGGGVAVDSVSPGEAHPAGVGRVRRLLASRWFWIPVLLGSSGAYYAVFFSYLAVVVGLGLALRQRDWRRLVRPLLCVALALGVLLANNLPTLVYQWRHGPNHVAAARQLGENDIYGLQVAYLLLPIDNYRIPAVRDFKAGLNDSVSPLQDSEQQALGLVAAIGLVVSLGALFLAGTGSKRGDRLSRLRRESGALNLAAILLATVGGLSTIVGLVGYVQLHAYTRMSIFIAFFSLVAVAAAFESWAAKRRRGRWPRVIAALLVGVCLFAAFDQTNVVPTDRRAAATAVASDRDFVHLIERRLGGKGQVFELPLVEYPEQLIPDAGSYSTDELGKPALFGGTLRWSWGAMKGRPEDLTPSYVSRPLESLLPQVAALGFDGIYIDRRGFLDNGAEIEARLETIVGAHPLVSEDGTKSFFDLRPYARRLPPASPATRDAALHPLQLNWGPGFAGIDGDGQFYPQLQGVTSGRWANEDATLQIVNPRSATRHLSLHATAQLASPAAGTLEVRAGHVKRVFQLSGNPTPITIEFDIPPGTTTISFHSSQPAVTPPAGGQPMAFRLNDIWWEAPLDSTAPSKGAKT